MLQAGLPEWRNYVMSADLEWLDDPVGVGEEEAGIVFHADSSSLYYFGVKRSTPPKCEAWEFYGGSPVAFLGEATMTALDFPVHLRMTRLHDGSFLCYANGTQLKFNDASYPAGGIGFWCSAEATFDNVQVFGGYGFMEESGTYEVLFADPMDHLDLDGTPYMWALLGEHPTEDNQSAWEVVNAGAAYGKVLKGTASGDNNHPTEAFRGDRSWINDQDEYMNYRIQANVKLESSNAEAGVCLRVRKDESGGTDRLYILQLTGGPPSELKLLARRWHAAFPPHWDWALLGYMALPNPTQWHTIAMEAVDNGFQCYLDGNPNPVISASDSTPGRYYDGLVGLWVQTSAALFDNVVVLDLR